MAVQHACVISLLFVALITTAAAVDCSGWSCTCQGASDAYGINVNASHEAPVVVQTWFKSQNCTTDTDLTRAQRCAIQNCHNKGFCVWDPVFTKKPGTPCQCTGGALGDDCRFHKGAFPGIALPIFFGIVVGVVVVSAVAKTFFLAPPHARMYGDPSPYHYNPGMMMGPSGGIAPPPGMFPGGGSGGAYMRGGGSIAPSSGFGSGNGGAPPPGPYFFPPSSTGASPFHQSNYGNPAGMPL